jgi:branched-chain amino acid aminotransferase
MAVNTQARTKTWTYVDGEWLEGNPPLIGPVSHAMWLGSTVFDGARWFDGVAPDLDLHCARVNRSADALGMRATMEAGEIEALAREGLKKFDGKTAVYIKPMYWAEHGGYMSVPADPDSTRFCLCLFESPMIASSGFSVTVSPFRRPTYETAPTNAKAGCLYPNNARMLVEARSKGFGNALVADVMGNVAETATANVFMVKDGVVFTPIANGTFLAGITRARHMSNLRADGIEVHETVLSFEDFHAADEVFLTGNMSKVTPVTAFDDTTYPVGPITERARTLYWDWAATAG